MVTVDVNTGLRHILSQKDTSLHKAVSASCAIPAMFPNVHINGHAYMDGGVFSGTHADTLLTDEPQKVLILAPLVAATADLGKMAEVSLKQEICHLENRGVEVIALEPNDVFINVTHRNLLDVRYAKAARQAGWNQGVALVSKLKSFWD